MAERTSEPPRDALARGASTPDATLRRERMVREQLRARGIRDERVLAAMGLVPRERFMPATAGERAYDDGAQPIGRGQTISQPFIVARMTEALHLEEWRDAHPGRLPRVLDVGTGSGYQAAVLAALGVLVTTIELDAVLAARAAGLFVEMGVEVHAVQGDGSEGYPPDAPYAGIVVAAAAPAIPDPLVTQLDDGGRLVLPVGPRERQELMVVLREGPRTIRHALEPCVFVPLLGRFGQDAAPR